MSQAWSAATARWRARPPCQLRISRPSSYMADMRNSPISTARCRVLGRSRSPWPPRPRWRQPWRSTRSAPSRRGPVAPAPARTAASSCRASSICGGRWRGAPTGRQRMERPSQLPAGVIPYQSAVGWTRCAGSALLELGQREGGVAAFDAAGVGVEGGEERALRAWRGPGGRSRASRSATVR